MEQESYILNSIEKLNNTIDKFKTNNCEQNDMIIIELLKGITVVEKESASGEVIFYLLKGNYFQSDLATAQFVNNLYIYDVVTLNTYFDIYLEQVYENELTQDAIVNNINYMRSLITKINSDLLSIFNEKLASYNEAFKL